MNPFATFGLNAARGAPPRQFGGDRLQNRGQRCRAKLVGLGRLFLCHRIPFPPDKGDPKWHRPSDKLFLGIDHTAIVAADTEASLKFYRDTLGMRVAGESENYGSEQEHLNNVFGARLRITSLRAAEGPGVELLEYLAPRTGRPMPEDSQVNDLWAWETDVVAANINIAAQALRDRKYSVVSSGIVTLSDTRLRFHSGILVRDPDGHILEMQGP